MCLGNILSCIIFIQKNQEVKCFLSHSLKESHRNLIHCMNKIIVNVNRGNHVFFLIHDQYYDYLSVHIYIGKYYIHTHQE